MERKLNGLSKSRYTLYRQCPALLWFKVHRPDKEVIDESAQERFDNGKIIGEIAQSLFGPYEDVTTYKEDGTLDLSAMADKTALLMKNPQNNVICEASFLKDNNYCAVDLLRHVDDGWEIYEVKSSTSNRFDEHKKAYIPDVAYQKWLLGQCGVAVKRTFLVVVNSEYIFDGKFDIKKYFTSIEMDGMISEELALVPEKVAEVEAFLESDKPYCQLGNCCKKPYPCAFKDYCYALHGIPEPQKGITNPRIQSMFELNGQTLRMKDMLKFYDQGKVLLQDIRDEDLKDNAKIQVECTLQNKDYIDVQEISNFLDKLSYPLYFLDFETFSPIVPIYKGTSPYQAIPFQYSLHWIEDKNSELRHTGFLAESDILDPRRDLAEQLCKDIPQDVCVIAYNNSTERSIIEKLAKLFPDLSEHLLNIAGNIEDLNIPFKYYYYYTPAMRGKTSIKDVLPAMFPDDPELDYHNLEGGIRNGSQAKNVFPKIRTMQAAEAELVRNALWQYCRLDTLATVKIWQKLTELVSK